ANADHDAEVVQQLEKDPEVAQVVRPVDGLPKQIFLFGEGYAALEGEADVAIAIVAIGANARIDAHEALGNLPRAIGRAVVDEDDLVVGDDGFQRIDGLLEE